MKNIKGLALSDPATAGESNGFTLIEILVVIALLGVLSVILTNILSQVLRGQNKINVVNLVKQNGQVILDQFSNEIRSAEKVICVGKSSTDPDDTIILFRNGNYTRFRLNNGYLQKNVFTIDAIPETIASDSMLCTELVDRGQTSFLNDSNNGVLVNYDGTKPIFEKQTPQPGFPELILIRFRGFQGINAGKTSESTVSDEGVLFSTAISVRGGK